MKFKNLLILFLSIIFLLSGCTTTTKSIEEEQNKMAETLKQELNNTTKIVLLKKDENGNFKSLANDNNYKYSIYKEITDKEEINNILTYFQDMYVFNAVPISNSDANDYNSLVWFYNEANSIICEYNPDGYVIEGQRSQILILQFPLFYREYF